MLFEMKFQKKDGKTLIEICGHIDEEAKFINSPDMTDEVFIDLANVGVINSIGIRAWINWFSSQTKYQFYFINCPKAIVMQMNMVEGFLPSNSRVLSMEVPFYCEKCDKEITTYFEVGKHIHVENGRIRLEYNKAGICTPSCNPELDVNEVKFFRFLMRDLQKAA